MGLRMVAKQSVFICISVLNVIAVHEDMCQQDEPKIEIMYSIKRVGAFH